MVIALCYMLNTMFYIEPLSNNGYKKAMREAKGYNERRTHTYNEGFEEKIEKLKKKYE